MKALITAWNEEGEEFKTIFEDVRFVNTQAFQVVATDFVKRFAELNECIGWKISWGATSFTKEFRTLKDLRDFLNTLNDIDLSKELVNDGYRDELMIFSDSEEEKAYYK